MKTLWLVLASCFLPSLCFAAETLDELIVDIEKGLATCSKGGFYAGFGEFTRISLKPKTPQELAADDDKNKEAFDLAATFGQTDEVDKVSTVHYGASLCRVRFLDKKKKGDILWTFGCYKSQGRWFLVSINMAPIEEPANVFESLDAADAAQPKA